MLLVWLLVGGLTFQVTKTVISRQLDAGLQETAQRLLPLALDDYLSSRLPQISRRGIQSDHPGFTTLLFSRELVDEKHPEIIIYQLIDIPTNKILLQSHQSPTWIAEAETFTAQGAFEIESAFGFNELTGDQRYGLRVLESRASREQAFSKLLLPILAPISLVTPLLLATLVLIVWRSLRPLRALVQAIADQNPEQPSQIEISQLPKDLQLLLNHLNGLMYRVSRLIKREKQFASNTAHELRTPLMLMTARLSRIIGASHEAQTRSELEQLQTNLQQLSRVTEKLLELARSDSDAPIKPTRFELAKIVDILMLEQQSKGVSIAHSIPGDVEVDTDLDAFGILLKNLLENAVKYNSNREIPIIIEWRDDKSLVIRNVSHSIPKTQLRSLQQRFKRIETKKPGHGLGLTIVAAIAERLGLTFDIAQADTGGICWFEACIRFPEV